MGIKLTDNTVQNNIAGGFGRGVDMVKGVLIRELESFKTKDELEEYGLKFDIDLDKKFKLENMYATLMEEVDKLR